MLITGSVLIFGSPITSLQVFGTFFLIFFCGFAWLLIEDVCRILDCVGRIGAFQGVGWEVESRKEES